MKIPAWLPLVLLLTAPISAHSQEPGTATVDLAAIAANAGKGDAQAELALGLIYEEGAGVDQDDAQARRWFRKAAEQNNGDAQFQLGRALSAGVGSWDTDAAGNVVWSDPGNVNYAEAYFWLSLAVNNKVADAAPARDEVAGHLTPAGIASAGLRVKHWREKLAALSLPQ